MKGARELQLLLVAALVFASVVAVFALQNAQTVPIRFFGWERETSVAVIALGAAAVGALFAVLAGLVRQLGAGLRTRHLKAELGRLQRELDEERKAKDALVAKLEEAREANRASGQQERLPVEPGDAEGAPAGETVQGTGGAPQGDPV